MEYRLIALDLDGTLLSSRKEVTPRTRDALRAARERGIVTAIATGRTPQSALHYSRTIGGGPVICCNGGGVLDANGSFISTRGIPDAPLAAAIDVCQAAGVLAECYTTRHIVMDQPLAHIRAYVNWVRPHVGLGQALRSLAAVWHTNRVLPVRNLRSWAGSPGRVPVLKLMVIGEAHRLGQVAEAIRVAAPGLEVTSSGTDNLEVMAPGISKGAGLALLGARLRIPAEAMLAFGDSENDLEMLSYAGTGVAMGNAPNHVRAGADRVAPSCDEDGVAQTIEELCLS